MQHKIELSRQLSVTGRKGRDEESEKSSDSLQQSRMFNFDLFRVELGVWSVSESGLIPIVRVPNTRTAAEKNFLTFLIRVQRAGLREQGSRSSESFAALVGQSAPIISEFGIFTLCKTRRTFTLSISNGHKSALPESSRICECCKQETYLLSRLKLPTWVSDEMEGQTDHTVIRQWRLKM